MEYLDAEVRLRKIADHDEHLVAGQGDAVDRVLDEVLDLRARVAAVRRLHQPLKEAPTWCGVCVDEDNIDQDWPCETIRALDVVPAVDTTSAEARRFVRVPRALLEDLDAVEADAADALRARGRHHERG